MSYNPLKEDNSDHHATVISMQQMPVQAAVAQPQAQGGVRMQTVAVPMPQGNVYPTIQPGIVPQQQQQPLHAEQVFIHVDPNQPQQGIYPAIVPQANVVGQPRMPPAAAPMNGNELVAVQPPVPTPEQLQDIARERVVRFGCGKYLKEGHNMVKYNCCATFCYLMTWVVFQVVLAVILLGIMFAIRGGSDYHTDMVWSDSSYVSYDYFYSYYDSSVWDSSDSDWIYSDDSYAEDIYDEDDVDPEPDHHHDHHDHEDDEAYDYVGHAPDEPMSEGRKNIGLMIAGVAVQGIFIICIFYPLTSGFFYAVFSSMRNNTHIRISHFFNGFKGAAFCRLLPLSLILSIVGAIGSEIFVIPGILWAVFTVFAIPLHLEHPHLSSWRAIKLSAKMVSRQCCNTFWYLILLGLIAASGILLLVVGVFYTIPLTAIAFCYMYHHLIGVNGVTLFLPATSPSLQPNSQRHFMLDAI